MEDVQGKVDHRGIAIQRVGVSQIRLPVRIETKSGGFQSVLATIRMTVDLPQEYKGTHMSRFLEVMHPWSDKVLSSRAVGEILVEMRERLQAETAHFEMDFEYFITKIAPISKKQGLLGIHCRFEGTLGNEKEDFVLQVDVPVTSLCPCSKEISTYGAHNQRSEIRVRVRNDHQDRYLWIEELVELLEAQASCSVYPVLKREDEKFVTEKAYENPKFVEDMVRDVVLALRAQPGISWFQVECENFESIHSHNAYAFQEETL
jgi:GTP cyclohydrolase I